MTESPIAVTWSARNPGPGGGRGGSVTGPCWPVAGGEGPVGDVATFPSGVVAFGVVASEAVPPEAVPGDELAVADGGSVAESGGVVGVWLA
jgi:hypothetical protein